MDLSGYQALCDNGEMFPRRVTTPLDLTYSDQDGVVVPIELDIEVLRATHRTYVQGEALRSRLAQWGNVAPLSEALAFLRDRLSRATLILSVAGYTLSGRSYADEARAINVAYNYLKYAGKRPDLVADGGVSGGVPGLSAYIAQHQGIETIGYIPRYGLPRTSPRTRMVVWGETYEDREVLVGSTSDLLLCFGGALGTMRECRASLRNHGVVVLIAVKDYGPKTLASIFYKDNELAEAFEEGRLLVCKLNELNGLEHLLAEELPQTLQAALDEVGRQTGFRQHRLASLEGYLS